ncbi:MAG: TonB-dependent receptor [Spongiibacteraceae bacterium]
MNNKVNKTRLSVAIMLAVGAAEVSTPVWAAASLEEVIVTARKTEEMAQDVPIAITAIGPETIQNQKIVGLYDLQRITPSLNIAPDAYGPLGGLVALRGQRQGDTLLSQSPAVGIYVDGVYQFATQGQALANMLDVERIEVLKGPQGTLFGRNTTGGAISITNKMPSDIVEGDLKVGFGNQNRKEVAGTFNTPLWENAALRLNAQSITDDGYGKNLTTDDEIGEIDNQLARAALKIDPTEAFEIVVRGEYAEGETSTQPKKLVAASPTGLAGVTVAAASGLFLPNPAFNPANPISATNAPVVPNAPAGAQLLLNSVPTSTYDIAYSMDPSQHVRSSGGSLTLSYDFNRDLTLKSISAYSESHFRAAQDSDGTIYQLLDSDQIVRQIRGYTQEFTLAGTSFDDKLDWVAGAYYYDTTGRDFDSVWPLQLVATTFRTTPQTTNSFLESKSLAGYTQGTYRLTDELGLTAGVRWTKDEQDLDSRNTQNGICSVPSAPGTCSAKFETSNINKSYMVTLDYKLSDDVLTYVRTARGFKAGGLNQRGGTSAVFFAPFDPEQVTDYEIGLKSELFDQRVRLNVSAYQSDYKDIQRTTIIPNPAGGIASVIGNAAAATIDGQEIELTAIVTDNLVLQLTGSHVKAEFDKYVVNGVDVSDRKFAIPEWQYSVGATYTLPTQVGDLRTNINWSWVDDQDFQPENHGPGIPASYSVQEAYGLLDARIALRIDSIDGEVALWGKNLTDKEYINGALDVNGAGFGFVTNNYAPPRTFGIEVSKHF